MCNLRLNRQNLFNFIIVKSWNILFENHHPGILSTLIFFHHKTSIAPCANKKKTMCEQSRHSRGGNQCRPRISVKSAWQEPRTQWHLSLWERYREIMPKLLKVEKSWENTNLFNNTRLIDNRAWKSSPKDRTLIRSKICAETKNDVSSNFQIEIIQFGRPDELLVIFESKLLSQITDYYEPK